MCRRTVRSTFAARAWALRSTWERLRGHITFRILLDGEELARFEQPVADLAQAAHRVVTLPPESRTGARLRFEASGPAAVGAILDPVLGPAEIGSPSARPWDVPGGVSKPRPNVVLFLADTFRADNMRDYGSEYEPSLTPNLDRFAEASVVFTRTWSPALVDPSGAGFHDDRPLSASAWRGTFRSAPSCATR